MWVDEVQGRAGFRRTGEIFQARERASIYQCQAMPGIRMMKRRWQPVLEGSQAPDAALVGQITSLAISVSLVLGCPRADYTVDILAAVSVSATRTIIVPRTAAERVVIMGST